MIGDATLRASAPHATVTIAPAAIARRRLATWGGIQADSVQVLRRDPFEYGFCSARHLLIASEQVARYDGESFVEGLPKSVLREFSETLTFVPAGHRFHGWHKPRGLARATYLYIEPHAPLLGPELDFAETAFKPRLAFADRNLWTTALKLGAEAENASPDRPYAEALGMVLAHELMRLNNPDKAPRPVIRGGLAAWQQKRVAEFIAEHLGQEIALSTLAKLAQLSPFHFAHAFKQSFGMPPHRYHTSRRMERAKTLLARQGLSITEIGHRLGYRETSSFTAAFRKVTGFSPSQFRRNLG
ncbi:MAG: helix-turn-helix transcriptional regulator [Proteobacteria bacterium]|nr:helix-turn-helix transcriptional regulator [Pseudomonadota bacterium]MBI3497058.1 helix-turn-helix transcriptional regulator [Pseudomonadota bacterium]